MSEHVCNESECPAIGGYYVSCMDAGKTYLMAGPYQTHAEALADKDKALRLADKHDRSGRAWFMAWGTCRIKEGELKPGRLNQHNLM